MSRQSESLHQGSGNSQTQIFPFGICRNLRNSETFVRQMDSCHSKDASYKSRTQTSIYEGKESFLGMTEKQTQIRKYHKFSEMLIVLSIFQKLCQGGVLISTPYMSGNCTAHSEEVQGWKNSELNHVHPGYTNWLYYFLNHICKEVDKLNKVEAQQMSRSNCIWGVKLCLRLLKCSLPLTSAQMVSYIGIGYV